MKDRFSRFVNRHTLALSFAIPFLGVVILMIISGYAPFGGYSMLYSDMYHQYYPFFVSFRRALLSGQSLLYNWDVGMGMDYLGLISYYLGSPLNLLSVLVPESWLLGFFSFLVPLKLGFASLFFTVFLRNLFGKKDLAPTLFGCFYGLCAWALGYQWNVMWLDTFALLPLVVLGMVRLLRDKKVVLYSVTLFFSVVINYYIGLFTCIFVALSFFCYEICTRPTPGRFFADLGRIALFSMIAIAMTAVMSLPTLAALQQTQSSVNSFPTGFRLNIASSNTWKGLLEGMRQVVGNLGGGLEPSFKEGLPNLYCGVFAVMLGFLYLCAGKVPLREKLCNLFLLVFFILSFLLRQLDYIWHGFHFPNMIPYRFSFLFSFVLLTMAYRAWLMMDSCHPAWIGIAAVISVGLFACSDKRFDPAFLAYNAGFVLFYTAFFLCRQMQKPRKPIQDPEDPEASQKAVLVYEKKMQDCHRSRRIGSVALGCTIALEIVMNLLSFGIHFPGTYVENYTLGGEHTASMIRYMKERESSTPFYRAEVTHTQTLNDGALNNYHGITTFTSSANVHVTEFMKALGYGAKNTYNRYSFEDSYPVANLFLGLKYMIARDGKVAENRYFDDVHHYGDVHLLQNNAYLPLGFLAEDTLADLDFLHSNSNFLFQNQLFRAATGLNGSVWSVLSGADTEVTGSDVSVSFAASSGTASYQDGGSAASVTFRFTADREGFACVDIDFPKRNNFTVWKNGTQLYSENISLPQMFAVCDVEAGDQIEIRVSCKSDEKGSLTAHLAILDDALFRQGYDILNSSVWQLSSFTNTRVEGTVDCDRDGLFYTSVPQNGNWKMLVDGKEVPVTLVGGVMVSASMSQGMHTVVLVYENPAFSLGWRISAGSLAVLILLFFLYLPRKKRRRGKYEA